MSLAASSLFVSKEAQADSSLVDSSHRSLEAPNHEWPASEGYRVGKNAINNNSSRDKTEAEKQHQHLV